jgi:hypothetical protein
VDSEMRTFDSNMSERMIGVGPTMWNDWRRKGFVRGVGEALETGRWVYNGEELLGAWLARRYLAADRPLATALNDARDDAQHIVALLRGQQPHMRFRIAATGSDGGFSRQVATMDELMEQARDEEAISWWVVDFAAAAHAVPDLLKAAFRRQR